MDVDLPLSLIFTKYKRQTTKQLKETTFNLKIVDILKSLQIIGTLS